MPGLQLIGPIAGRVFTQAPDPATQALESHGLFVIGDAISIRHYSGGYPGYRWLCRATGKLLERINVGALTQPVHAVLTRAEAEAAYAALRQQAIGLGLTAVDARSEFPLNDPSCYAERFSMNGEELLRLFYDHMTDLQVCVRNTDAIAQFDAKPGDEAAGSFATYHTQNQVLYLAVARAASGCAEHLVIVFSDSHKPHPTIEEGLPAAEWIKSWKQSTLAFPSGVAVVTWGRLSGAEAESQEDAQDPVRSLLAKLGTEAAVPLAPPAYLAPRLGHMPASYAVRMEPGMYKATYYELDTKEHGGFSCCAISREGAPPFLPVALGNAGGMIHGGLSMEKYAMLTVERDDLLMRMGGPGGVSSPEMAALCQKYGIPLALGLHAGHAGRVEGWDLMIQRDPAFSAQWTVQLGIARYRLQGVEPTKEQIDALAQHQSQVQTMLEANNKRFNAMEEEKRKTAQMLIELARTQDIDGLVAACKREAPSCTPAAVFYLSLKRLKDEKKYGKVERVEEVTEKLARAHHATMDASDQKFYGKVDSYVKETIGEVYPQHGAKVPGFAGAIFRFLDKL